MTQITAVDAWEVLDSRGDPTVRVKVETTAASGVFTVPAGASTGSYEVAERRDGGERYRGRGVRDAVAAIEEDLAPVVVGRDVQKQAVIDEELRACDGTPDLSRVGGNAVLGVSGATARAAAAAVDRPLHAHLGDGSTSRLPMPMVNVVSGGLHAGGGLEIQDILVVPVGGSSYSEAIETVWAVRAAVKDRIEATGYRPLVADEGGFSPPLESVEEGFELVMAGIDAAGYRPGDGVSLAVDVAASHFYDAGTETYHMARADGLDRRGMVDLVEQWVDDWPIVSVEDPLAEDDWPAWATLLDRIGDAVQVVGDDLIVTNQQRLDRAIDDGAANAVLVKPNQTGTITRTIEVVRRAQDAGIGTVISARSGETCDSTIADLAVGLDAGQIKVGSLARSERLAKYNRLLEIERSGRVPFATPDL